MTDNEYLKQAAALGLAYRAGVNTRSPYPELDAVALRALFDTGLPDKGRPGSEVISQLADAAEKGLVGLTGDAFFGWVMGASNQVGVAAEWLTAAWGQNAGIYQTSPSAAIAEEVAGNWLIDLLDLPAQSSIAFTTGATMASYVCLAAARTHVLHEAGWDLEAQGQFGAPEIAVYISAEAHTAIYTTLRYLGFGQQRLHIIEADNQGRMLVADLAKQLAGNQGPAIIIAQAGHINTGAFDDFNAINALAQQHNAWVHIDGAFGLWVKTASGLEHLADGAEQADSWAVDGHKWLQVPYDSGFGIIKNSVAHRRAMTMTGGYLNQSVEDGRDPKEYVPELSRRARGYAVWAVLQNLGREGIADLVEGNCANAARLADKLNSVAGVRVLNKVCLNQLALVFEDEAGQARTIEVVRQLQVEGKWFIKEADWRGEIIMRLSFSSTAKRDAEVDSFATDIIAAWERVKANDAPVL